MTSSCHQRHRMVLGMLFVVLGPSLICPGLSLAATPLQTYGGSGGNPFWDECPRGSYLVGLNGRAGEWVDRLATVCAPWLWDKQTFGPPTVGRYHGDSTGGEKRDKLCWGFGNNSAIQSWQVTRLRGDPGGASHKFVRYIRVSCTTLTSPIANLKFTFAGPIIEDQGSTDFSTLGTNRPDAPLYTACPTGEIAIGIHGTSGLFLDSIGLLCGPSPAKFVAPPAATANPLAKAPVPSNDMFSITWPRWNDPMKEGQLIIKATKPKVGMTQVTQLEFKWLDAPPNQPYANNVAVDTNSLFQGYPVPQHVTRGQAGRWEVRARASGKPVPGPWSFPVMFRLFVTQPTQSQKQSSPIQQTAPLPSSAVTVPSAIQQTAPLPSSAVTEPSPIQQTTPLPSSAVTAPPPSSAPAPMRRSSSMIMPRGIEGNHHTNTNEIVGTSPHPEKKP